MSRIVSMTINIHLEAGPLCLVPVPHLRSLRGRFEFASHSFYTHESLFVAGEFERGTSTEGDFRRREGGTPGAEKRGCGEDRSENTEPEIALPTACRHVDTFDTPIPDGEWVFLFFHPADCRAFFGIKLGTNRRR